MDQKEILDVCLKITGAFEGAGYDHVAGNFDGAGISFGILQWNFYSKTLQPLLYSMYNSNYDLFDKICGRDKSFAIVQACIAGTHYEEQDFIGRITTGRMHIAQTAAHFSGGVDVLPEWQVVFASLGNTFKDKELEAALPYYNDALDMCKEFGLKTLRSVTLMFDQAVQRGKTSLDDEAKKYLVMKTNPSYDDKTDKWWQKFIIDDDVADVSSQWRSDVLSRRMCIINGSGVVHKTFFNLDKDFGLSDVSII